MERLSRQMEDMDLCDENNPFDPEEELYGGNANLHECGTSFHHSAKFGEESWVID